MANEEKIIYLNQVMLIRDNKQMDELIDALDKLSNGKY